MHNLFPTSQTLRVLITVILPVKRLLKPPKLHIRTASRFRTAKCASKFFLVIQLLSQFFTQSNGRAAVISSFTAEGNISCVRFKFHDTNFVMRTSGKVLFSYYSNNLWRVQFTYSEFSSSKPSDSFQMGTILDCRRIPDGTRQIVIWPTNDDTHSTGQQKTLPYATTETLPFPLIIQQMLFVPWLSLCPKPELPVISSNRIHFNFSPQALNHPKNEGGFNANYIAPENVFLEKLEITNNGTIFQPDGGIMSYPKPYQNGFLQLSYEVLATTNYNGITFPLKSVFYQFAPTPNGKNGEDIYPAIITRLELTRFDFSGQNLTLVPISKDIVALDSRPSGLNNGVTVNYNVTNDEWYSLTNKRIEQLTKFFERQPFNRVKERDKYARNRLIIFSVLSLITLIPLVGYALKKTKQKQKMKGNL